MTAVFWQSLTQAVFEDDVTIPEIAYTGRLAGPLPVSELLAETIRRIALGESVSTLYVD
jgi:phosphoribosylpyrophosphate synthetase